LRKSSQGAGHPKFFLIELYRFFAPLGASNQIGFIPAGTVLF